MRLFHGTTIENANRILSEGFKDGEGNYGTSEWWTGVWLSNYPLDVNDTDRDLEAMLEVALDVDEADLDEYEWVQEGCAYREWLVPASVINTRGTVRLVDASDDELFELRQVYIESLKRARR